MKKENLRVISVYNRYLNRGGEDEVFEAEGQLLQRNGCEVSFVTEDVSFPRDMKEKVCLAFNANWSRKWHSIFHELLNDIKPDVVHVHNFFPNISPSIHYACQEARVPVIQTLHNYRLFCPAATFFRDGKVCEECVDHSLWRGVRYGCYRDSRLATASVALMLATHRMLKTWAQKVNCYIALTEFARRTFIRAALPAEKIAVKPNFVYPDPGARHGGGEHAVFVGRLSEEKGSRTLLTGWEKSLKHASLRVIGDGPLRAELETEAAKQRLHTLRFEGRLSRDKCLAAIKGARFLIFPSEWYEGFPMTIAEAFACGVPVICSRLGAMQEIVEDQRTGLHFNPGDAEDLAEKVEWAWSHPKQMEAMGREARAEYEAKYTAEKNYPILMDIYRQAMALRS